MAPKRKTTTTETKQEKKQKTVKKIYAIPESTKNGSIPLTTFHSKEDAEKYKKNDQTKRKLP